MDKKYTYIALGVVVLLLIVYAVSRNSGSNSTSQTNNQEQAAAPQPSPSPATSTPTPSPTPAKLSYGAAINAYKFRFQFTQCHASPGMISVPKNTPVMLDNRDKVAHTIKANGQSFRIAGDDYALIYPQLTTGSGVNLADSNVTCDGGGAGTLNVEK